jgi:hypothetical protein
MWRTRNRLVIYVACDTILLFADVVISPRAYTLDLFLGKFPNCLIGQLPNSNIPHRSEMMSQFTSFRRFEPIYLLSKILPVCVPLPTRPIHGKYTVHPTPLCDGLRFNLKPSHRGHHLSPITHHRHYLSPITAITHHTIIAHNYSRCPEAPVSPRTCLPPPTSTQHQSERQLIHSPGHHCDPPMRPCRCPLRPRRAHGTLPTYRCRWRGSGTPCMTSAHPRDRQPVAH